MVHLFDLVRFFKLAPESKDQNYWERIIVATKALLFTRGGQSPPPTIRLIGLSRMGESIPIHELSISQLLRKSILATFERGFPPQRMSLRDDASWEESYQVSLGTTDGDYILGTQVEYLVRVRLDDEFLDLRANGIIPFGYTPEELLPNMLVNCLLALPEVCGWMTWIERKVHRSASAEITRLIEENLEGKIGIVGYEDWMSSFEYQKAAWSDRFRHHAVPLRRAAFLLP